LIGGQKGDVREVPVVEMASEDRTLFISGTKDDMMDFDLFNEVLSRSAAAPVCTLVRMEDCDHSLKLQRKKAKASSGQTTTNMNGTGPSTMEEVDANILDHVRTFCTVNHA
jgi:hypothetical protein